MSNPDIGTLSVRFSIEERRLLEDFARISGATIEELIREALFLPPIGARARRHLRLVHSAASGRVEAPAAFHPSRSLLSGSVAAAPAPSASPAAAQRD
jgi:hypothetical protein